MKTEMHKMNDRLWSLTGYKPQAGRTVVTFPGFPGHKMNGAMFYDFQSLFDDEEQKAKAAFEHKIYLHHEFIRSMRIAADTRAARLKVPYAIKPDLMLQEIKPILDFGQDLVTVELRYVEAPGKYSEKIDSFYLFASDGEYDELVDLIGDGRAMDYCNGDQGMRKKIKPILNQHRWNKMCSELKERNSLV